LGVELHFLFVTQPVVLVEKVPSPSFLPGIKEAKEYVETRGGIFRLKKRGSFFQLWRFGPFCNRRYLCLNSFRHVSLEKPIRGKVFPGSVIVFKNDRRERGVDSILPTTMRSARIPPDNQLLLPTTKKVEQPKNATSEILLSLIPAI